MPHRRFVVHWLFICLATWWLAVGAQADEVASPKSSADLVTFAAWVEHGEFIGDEQLRRLFVTCGTNQLGMLVPTGLRADLSRADRVTLTAPDMSYYLTVKIKETEFRSQNSEFWIQDSGFRSRLQQQVLEHFPGALLTEESSLEIAGKRGPLFNLRWKPAENVDRLVSVTFVASPAGLIEFSVVADRLKDAEAQNALSAMLCRLQSGERGRLKMDTFRQPDYN